MRRQHLPEVVCGAFTLPPRPSPPPKTNLGLERKKPPECLIISHQRLLTLAVVWHWHQPSCFCLMELSGNGLDPFLPGICLLSTKCPLSPVFIPATSFPALVVPFRKCKKQLLTLVFHY